MQTGFEKLESHTIASLNVELQRYRHEATGAEHYHLAADHDENVFMVALRTMPQDNTGVAHILEHTVLCGSERYPVRDPFFLMMRRSLNTFMNAFTASDWTAYPFASENDKDFFNLLDVYLDSVFFSNLAELDFAQEGHRLGFRDDDIQGSLEYRGVVYNEMKGAMSSAPARLYQAITRYMFPTTTYHFNSGGEPQSIPRLTYDELKRFYRHHYHPSNAIFLTFGRVEPTRVQAEIAEKVLARFSAPETPVVVPPEERYAAPIQVTEHYPVAPAEGDDPQDHVVVGWLLGESADIHQQLEAHFLSEVLMGNSSSPLREALETTELAASASPLMGVEDSNREMMLVCGVEGTEASRAEAVETLILETLQRVVEEGIDPDDQAAVLHQLELSQREIGGDGMPFGLQLIMTALPVAVHRGSVSQALDIDQALTRMREQIADPDYVRGLVSTRLLDNPHRVRLTFKADTAFQDRADREEQHRLERLARDLDDQERQHIAALNRELEAHQQSEPDLEQLPRVTLEDIPTHLKTRFPAEQTETHTAYAEGTNGLTYLTWVRPLGELNADQLRWLPLYTMALSEVGQGGFSYQDIQRQQARVTGGLGAGVSARALIDDPQHHQRFLNVSGKALTSNGAAMNDLLFDTVHKARFDESGRLHELLQTLLLRRLQGVTGNGHSLAMLAATAPWATAAAQQHWQSGLSGLVWLKSLVKSDKDAYINEVEGTLKVLHEELSGLPGHLLAIAEPEWLENQLPALCERWSDQGAPPHAASITAGVPEQPRHTAWLTDTPVNYCARAFPTIPVSHPDAAVLAVLAGVLSNGFLHRAVREQGGAYGGGASHDLANGVFRFFSYRDPRLTDTFADFDRAIDWLLDKDHGYQPVEEAILGLVSGMEKPGSPAGEARRAFFDHCFGREPEFRETLRSRILAVTEEDLERVASTWLTARGPDQFSQAVVTGADRSDQCRQLGMDITEI